MSEILLHFGLGLLGILIYTLWKAKDYIFNKEFVLYTMLTDNYKSWIWSSLMLLALVVVVYLEPSLKDSLKLIFSIDLEASPAGFFMFGATINLLIKPSSAEKNRRAKKKMVV